MPENGWLKFGSPPQACSRQFRETECSFLFVSTPKHADCVQILMRAGGLPGLHNLEAELNYFVISNWLVFFFEEMNLFISDWRQESKGLSVVLCSQCLQAVRAQGGPKHLSKKDLKGGAYHLWNPSSFFPPTESWRAEAFFFPICTWTGL